MFCSVIAPRASQALLVYEHYVDMLDRAGSDTFKDTLAETLRAAKVDEFAAFFHKNGSVEPQLILAGGTERAQERANGYKSRFYRYDVLERIFDATQAHPLFVARIRAAEITNPDYRRVSFSQPAYLEKLLVLHKVPDGWVVLNLFRNAKIGAFTAAEITSISELAQVMMPIVATHSRLSSGSTRMKPLSIADIEMRINAAFPALSAREQAVCARTLAGVTAEGIAIDLGIKQTTVLTYRRRAYERLNISTVHQLSTMLIR